jgi:hypothetical protein
MRSGIRGVVMKVVARTFIKSAPYGGMNERALSHAIALVSSKRRIYRSNTYVIESKSSVHDAYWRSQRPNRCQDGETEGESHQLRVDVQHRERLETLEMEREDEMVDVERAHRPLSALTANR